MNRPNDNTMLCDNESTIGLNGIISKIQFSAAQRDYNRNSVISQVASSTRIGILSFQGHNIHASQEKFIAALQLLQGRDDPLFGDKGASSSACIPPADTLTTQQRQLQMTTLTLSSKKTLCCPPVAVLHNKKNNNNPPRLSRSLPLTCDEGLRELSEVIMFSDDADFASIFSTLHYNIAQTYLALKSYTEAMIWFRQSLEQHATLHNPLTKYKTLHNLGFCSYQTQDNKGAMEYFNKACEELGRLGLVDDCMATSTYNCIGVIFFNLDTPDTEAALQAFQKSFEIYQSNPTGFNSTEMATLLNNFGRVYYLKGEFVEKAIGFYQQALTLRRQHLGEHHIDVAATYYNLGNAYHKVLDLSRALECYDGFLGIAETCLGHATQEVAFVHKCKAEILQEMKDADSALKHYNKALVAAKSTLGAGHREVGCILNKAGNLCFEQGDYEEALKYYVWGLEIEKCHPNRDETLMLVTLTNLAQTHKHLGRIELALAFYKEVFAIQNKVTSTNELDIASTLSSIGLMLYHLKKYDEAFETYQEALRIRRDHHGSDENADVASCLNAIGLVLFKQGMYELCTRCFNECLEIRRKIFGADHNEVAMCWYNLASVSFETGDDEAALKLYEEALRIERAILGDQHPDIVLTMVHLGQVKQQLGLLDDAVDIFREAIRLHRQQGKEDGLREARIYNSIGNCFLQAGAVGKMMEAFAAASRILLSLGCPDEPLAIKGYNLYGLTRLHPEAAPMA